MVNGTYKLQGNRLVINIFQANSKVKRESQEIKINRNTLTFRAKQGQGEITGIRLDRSTRHSPTIIGRWAFNHGIPEGKWEIVFNKNGQFTSKFEFHPEKSSYKINGDMLIINRDKDEAETAKFWVEGGVLFLQWPHEPGSVNKFRRIE